jgi:dynein heavy chain 1
MEKVDGIKGESYIIDPKAINKDELYGKLDSTTAEWTDGVFTQTLRKVIDNHRGESAKRHWIIFDGDVDPEWAENLNSVLDDNKLLTLPSGERLQVPSNVRIMFEVETLKYATLATVSRCGMVWFSDDTVTIDMIYSHYLMRLKQDDYDSLGDDPDEKQQQDGTSAPAQVNLGGDAGNYELRKVRKQCVDAIQPLFDDSETTSFMTKTIEYAETLGHIMDFTKIRVLESFFALVRRGISNVIEYNENHSDFPLSESSIAAYMTKWVVFCAMWGVGGSMNLQTRTDFSEELRSFSTVDMPPVGDASPLDYEVRVDDQ